LFEQSVLSDNLGMFV